MLYLTRRETFNAAHKLFREEWSVTKNLAVFGACSNENWHGHNYQLWVTVAGQPDPLTGFVMDAKWLSTLVREQITNDIDHSNINLDVDWFPNDLQPTSENLCLIFWQRLEKEIAATGARLHRIRLSETENITADYYGPNGQ